MESHIKLGRILGIQIGVHYSWFLIAVLITFSLIMHFRTTQPDWTTAVVWVCAIVTALLFFAALVAHELSHALTARSRGLPVGAITLFALGGVSRIEREAEDPQTELAVGLVGPVTSLFIGGACFAVARLAGWQPGFMPDTPLPAVLIWLGFINVALAVFNMIPGFPLDGGRVLRALLWWVTGDGSRATRLAARGGQIVAYLFMAFGVVELLSGGGLGGLWIALIGWFLLAAAGAAYGREKATELPPNPRPAAGNL